MTEIFVDGIRTVAVANGVARIEMMQLKRGDDGTKLEPRPVATLMLPVAGLKEFTTQLTNAIKAIEENAKTKGTQRGGGGAPAHEVDTALENL